MPLDQRAFPCKNCGGEMRFAPGKEALICAHCASETALAAPSEAEARLALVGLPLEKAFAAPAKKGAAPAAKLHNCQSCGAQVDMGGLHASECPFCAGPLVLAEGAPQRLSVQAMLPFVIPEADARARFDAWLAKRWFAPSALKREAQKDGGLRGIYLPFWSFAADTDSRYSGERGEYYYETVTKTETVDGKNVQKSEQVRHTRWKKVSGQWLQPFKDMLVAAAKGLPANMVEKLEPWGLQGAKPYRPEYLAGFEAEAYALEPEEAHKTARRRMEVEIARAVRRQIGGDEQRIGQIDTAYREETVQHLLLPVWASAYRFRGKVYRFVVNGESGAVQGERPWDWAKIGGLVLGVVLLGLAVVYFTNPGLLGLGPR